MPRKVTLKVNVTCRKCKDKLIKHIHLVPGVKKVEITSECCPLFIITGNFQVDDILKATEKKRKCITVESVEELPEPKPEPPKPEPKPEPPKPEPKPEPPKAVHEPPKVAPPKVDEPETQICVVTADGRGWPKLKNFPNLPPNTSLVIMVENLVLCPQGGGCGGHGGSDCDSCC